MTELTSALLAVGTLLTAIFSGIAAIYAARAHNQVVQLDIHINGRMEQLIEKSHALGVAESGVTGPPGPAGPQGEQGVQGIQGPK